MVRIKVSSSFENSIITLTTNTSIHETQEMFIEIDIPFNFDELIIINITVKYKELELESFEFKLGELIINKRIEFKPEIIVEIIEINEQKQYKLKMKFELIRSPLSSSLFTRSAAFLRFLNNFGKVVYETNKITSTGNPSWNNVSLYSWDLCGDHDNIFQIEYYEFKKEQEKLIGKVEIILENFVLENETNKFDLRSLRNKKVGVLKLTSIKTKRVKRITEILNEKNIFPILAIDFSASNGTINHIESFHSFKYLNLIKNEIPKILQYSFNSRIPVFGFGAILKTLNNQLISSDIFPLNNNYIPDCFSINQIISNYKKSVKKIWFHGPSLLNLISLAAFNIQKQLINDIVVIIVLSDGGIIDINDSIQYNIPIVHLSVTNSNPIGVYTSFSQLQRYLQINSLN